MLKISFVKGVMHQHIGFAVYVEFTQDNLMETSKGLRYKYNDYWYLITDDTEFVYA